MLVRCLVPHVQSVHLCPVCCEERVEPFLAIDGQEVRTAEDHNPVGGDGLAQIFLCLALYNNCLCVSRGDIDHVKDGVRRSLIDDAVVCKQVDLYLLVEVRDGVAAGLSSPAGSCPSSAYLTTVGYQWDFLHCCVGGPSCCEDVGHLSGAQVMPAHM
eukprot:4285947-Amphidinium_carterae.1